MKKIIIYSLAFAIIMPLMGEGLQLFGSKKASEKEEKSEQKASSQRDDMTEDFSTTEVATRKDIESVIPVKRIPVAGSSGMNFWHPGNPICRQCCLSFRILQLKWYIMRTTVPHVKGLFCQSNGHPWNSSTHPG